jgi:hypothetical protein
MHSKKDVHLKLPHSEKQDEPWENTKFQWQPMGFWSSASEIRAASK